VYVTYFGTSTLSIIDISLDNIETSGALIEGMIVLVVAIAAASIAIAILVRKRQARLSKTQN
jgi:uncharacterized membrane protein